MTHLTPPSLRAREAEIRAKAAKLLLSRKPRSFYALGLLDLRRFRTNGEWLLDTLEAFSARTGAPLPEPCPDGMTLRQGNRIPLILYRANLHPHRRNWTIAHELGHLFLHHTAPSAQNEHEADTFAASLLMPPCVITAWEELHGMPMSVEELCRAFAVSPLAAKRCRCDLDANRGIVYSKAERELAKMLFAAKTV